MLTPRVMCLIFLSVVGLTIGRITFGRDDDTIEVFQLRRVASNDATAERLPWLCLGPRPDDLAVESTALLDTSALRSVRVVPTSEWFDLLISFTDSGRAAFDEIWVASIGTRRELAWVAEGKVIHAGPPASRILGTEVRVFARLTEADAHRIADRINQRVLELAPARPAQ